MIIIAIALLAYVAIWFARKNRLIIALAAASAMFIYSYLSRMLHSVNGSERLPAEIIILLMIITILADRWFRKKGIEIGREHRPPHLPPEPPHLPNKPPRTYLLGLKIYHHEGAKHIIPPRTPEPPHHLHHKPGSPPPPPKPHKIKNLNEDDLPVMLFVASIAVICLAQNAGLNLKIVITVLAFFITMITIFIRPRGVNEAFPAAAGAVIVLFAGVVSYDNVVDIMGKIRGASITIIATIVMTVILESFGFFHWAASRISTLAKGSGYRLYWYIELLCFLMTLLFNNDGSILITTPILILLLRNLRLKPHEQVPYLLAGALIATASSAPIGVSNITNLIALNIVHMTLYMHTAMMFVPCSLGLLFMTVLMFFVLKNRLPKTLPEPEIELEDMFFEKQFRPLKGTLLLDNKQKRTALMLKILAFVFGIRCLIFVASYFRIPIEIVAVCGSIALLIWRWYCLRTNPVDILKKTPWHIFVFAFSMYVLIYGLNNIGLTKLIVYVCEPIVNKGLLQASFTMGGLISVMSDIFNNHPALMIGTIALTNMGLNPITLKMIYLANIIGSDIGSLFLPIGTLASLMWLYILKLNRVRVSWREYISVTIVVIPLTLVVTLFLLYGWVQLVFVR